LFHDVLGLAFSILAPPPLEFALHLKRDCH
jgi:hypothetical protein